MKTQFFAALLAIATASVPLGALAQTGAYGETIHGSIVSVDGAGNLQLKDDRGFVDSVRLDPNVNVEPAGVQLQPGMRVTISGANAGQVFAAEQVAVSRSSAPQVAQQPQPPPYATGPADPYAAAPYPYPAPYPAPYPVYAPYPYPVYPYPVYAYPSYPRFSIGIGFGPSYGRGGHRR